VGYRVRYSDGDEEELDRAAGAYIRDCSDQHKYFLWGRWEISITKTAQVQLECGRVSAPAERMLSRLRRRREGREERRHLLLPTASTAPAAVPSATPWV